MITPVMPGPDRASLLIESCCTTLEEALSAQALGADRIELCTDLSVGGVTPPRDLICAVIQALTIPVNVLIRPGCPVDAGHDDVYGHSFHVSTRHSLNGFSSSEFVYDEDDMEAMTEDISFCKSAGAAGIVVGALTPGGRIDVAAMQRLVAAAQPLPVTFHRAFDVSTEDPFEAVDQIISLGCTRLLTSGQADNAWEGRDLIAQLVQRAGDRLIILAGRGVTPQNIESLAAATGAREFHGTQLP